MSNEPFVRNVNPDKTDKALLPGLLEAIGDAWTAREDRQLWAFIKGWLRRCPECGRLEDWLMKAGSRICHGCGRVS